MLKKIIHHEAESPSDYFALLCTKFLRVFADTFFAGRYGHRAVVLDTVAGVPGMVGGTLQHLKSLRHIENDQGWIKTLLDEAENERMHLMTFIEIAKPNSFERLLIILAQDIFYNLFFLLYLISSKTTRRLVGYFEEEAVYSYTEYLQGIREGKYENIPAPQIAIDYWHLKKDARLSDVILAVRKEEMNHRDVNYSFSNHLSKS